MNKVTIIQEKSMDYKTQEAVRALGISLINNSEFDNTVVFVSYMGKEGKSFIAWNVARTLASADKSCIYINANLRSGAAPDVYETEKINCTLAAYLKGESQSADLVHATDKEGFYMVEAGAPCEDAAELLNTETYDNLIKDLRKEYDYVVIDTPALGEVPDALISGNKADGVVIVMERGMVPYEQAQKMKKQLEINDCKVLGVVLNK